MKCIVNVPSIASPSIHINPRLRVFGKAAEFETELHLERFFLATVLPKLQLKPLASQYTCGQGICDILAIGASNQLIIIELKNTKDTHVIEQITRYFDALVAEKPFESQVDYAQPIELYTVCPDYADSLAMTLKYHRLNFNVLAYRIKNEQDTHRFELWNWLSHEAISHIEIPRAENTPDKSALPEPPKAFLKLLEKCTDREHSQASLIRQQIYEFSQNHNYKICERPDGQWIRFERNKQYPIAEIGWDSQRTELVIHLWLPFTTINGRLNLRRYPKYKRTSMMRIWGDNDEVKYLGYIHNSRRRWLIVTLQELKDERFPIPTKLDKWLKYTEGQYWISEGGYWKGLAMPFKTYTGIMDLPDLEMSLQSVVQLALEHSLYRYTQQRNRQRSEAVPSDELGLTDLEKTQRTLE